MNFSFGLIASAKTIGDNYGEKDNEEFSVTNLFSLEGIHSIFIFFLLKKSCAFIL